MKTTCYILGAWLVAVWLTSSARADSKSQLAKKAAEFVLERWGAKAVGGVTALARQIETLALRHGHEAFEAVKRIGPRTFQLVEQAGVHAKEAVRLMALHGEHGVAWVLSRPKAMAMFLQHGDKAAVALCKHPGIAEPIIGSFGAPAVRALEATGAQGGRRLAMLVQGGEFAKMGRSQELLEVIAKYGDRAMSFVWANKGALATTAGITAFLANPESFIKGAGNLAGVVGEIAVKPIMQIPGAVATEVARGTNWTIILLAAGIAGLLFLAVKYFQFGKGLQATLNMRQEAPSEIKSKNGQPINDAPSVPKSLKQ